MNLLTQLVLKPLLVVLLAAIGGVSCGVAPCYLVPQTLTREFCGYKSEPPHFVTQFWFGCVLTALTTIYFLYLRHRHPKPPRDTRSDRTA